MFNQISLLLLRHFMLSVKQKTRFLQVSSHFQIQKGGEARKDGRQGISIRQRQLSQPSVLQTSFTAWVSQRQALVTVLRNDHELLKN